MIERIAGVTDGRADATERRAKVTDKTSQNSQSRG